MYATDLILAATDDSAKCGSQLEAQYSTGSYAQVAECLKVSCNKILLQLSQPSILPGLPNPRWSATNDVHLRSLCFLLETMLFLRMPRATWKLSPWRLLLSPRPVFNFVPGRRSIIPMLGEAPIQICPPRHLATERSISLGLVDEHDEAEADDGGDGADDHIESDGSKSSDHDGADDPDDDSHDGGDHDGGDIDDGGDADATPGASGSGDPVDGATAHRSRDLNDGECWIGCGAIRYYAKTCRFQATCFHPGHAKNNKR